MKINEAPEKLYLHPTTKGEVGASWLTFKLTNDDIEYTRTDAFIEEACNWLKEHTLEYAPELNCGVGKTQPDYYTKHFILDFIRYMKGE